MNVAAFVNLENVFHPEWLKSRLSRLEEHEKLTCFFSPKGDMCLNSLCSGVKADYRDYEYVLLMSAPERGEYELLEQYVLRQQYYFYGMILSDEIFGKLLDLMERNRRIGAITLPLDFLQAENWKDYENWSDYYNLVKRWLRCNNLHIPIDQNKPPIINCPVALIRTEAIRGIEELTYRTYETSFLAYAISLYCQSRGFLPCYAAPKSVWISNYFGHEDFTSLREDMLKAKQEYYRQNGIYKKSHMDWQTKRIEELENQLEVLQQSNSWRITAPLRHIHDIVKQVCKKGP